MSSELQRTVDDIVDDTLSTQLDSLKADIADRLRNQCEALVEQVRRRDSGSAETTEALLAGLRQIQRGETVVDVAGALVHAAASFCSRSALLINRGDTLLGFQLAGENVAESKPAFQELVVNLLDATAFEGAVDTARSVVASGDSRELSSGFTKLLELDRDDRVGLFPVRLRDKVLAILYCDSKGSKSLQSTPIEALVSSTEGWIEAVSTRKRSSRS